MFMRAPAASHRAAVDLQRPWQRTEIVIVESFTNRARQLPPVTNANDRTSLSMYNYATLARNPSSTQSYDDQVSLNSRDTSRRRDVFPAFPSAEWLGQNISVQRDPMERLLEDAEELHNRSEETTQPRSANAVVSEQHSISDGSTSSDVSLLFEMELPPEAPRSDASLPASTLRTLPYLTKTDRATYDTPVHVKLGLDPKSVRSVPSPDWRSLDVIDRTRRTPNSTTVSEAEPMTPAQKRRLKHTTQLRPARTPGTNDSNHRTRLSETSREQRPRRTPVAEVLAVKARGTTNDSRATRSFGTNRAQDGEVFSWDGARDVTFHADRDTCPGANDYGDLFSIEFDENAPHQTARTAEAPLRVGKPPASSRRKSKWCCFLCTD